MPETELETAWNPQARRVMGDLKKLRAAVADVLAAWELDETSLTRAMDDLRVVFHAQMDAEARGVGAD